MSAGRSLVGAGCVTWWGFSPARDLLTTGPVREQSEVNILLVGSSDPRHVLKTMSGLKDTDRLHIWVIENNMAVVARQLLLLYLSLTPQENTGLHKKTELFLEVFGNSELRSETGEAVRQAAVHLCRYVTDCLETETHTCLNTTRLKFRERDELAETFRMWIRSLSSSSSGGSGAMSAGRVWDGRVRQHLGTRYDSRRGCFDWDLVMKLHQRGCSVISKQQYVRWREQGLAYEMREGIYQITNPTLLSTRIVNHRGDKMALSGYWGDIVTSPFLSFGIETEDQTLLQTQNGIHVKTAQDIAFANVQLLFQSLSCRGRCLVPSQQDAEEAPTESPETHHNPSDTDGLMHLSGISVTFLPLDALSKLPEKPQFSHFFDRIYLSASLAHQVGSPLRGLCAPEGVLVVELARFLLDLSTEQVLAFTEQVVDGAKAAGFEPWTAAQPDSSVAIFTLPESL